MSIEHNINGGLACLTLGFTYFSAKKKLSGFTRFKSADGHKMRQLPGAMCW
jgi:hypothetical protein